MEKKTHSHTQKFEGHHHQRYRFELEVGFSIIVRLLVNIAIYYFTFNYQEMVEIKLEETESFKSFDNPLKK